MASGAVGSSNIAVSIITTSYNQLPALRMLLVSLARQTVRGFEVIVADDGSSDGTVEYCRSRPYPWLHIVTQPDLGYRKAKIVNEAIRVARADYLIFLDSDVILEPHFVEDHLALRIPEGFVCGRRVDLGPRLTPKITEWQIADGVFDEWLPAMVFASAVSGDTIAAKRGLRITSPWLRRLMGYEKPIDILGSNFSAWRKDVVEINGFNEALESYWGEDGDLFIRLRNKDKKAVNAKGMCIQYHLFHLRRQPTPENIEKVNRLLQDRSYVWAEKGLNPRQS